MPIPALLAVENGQAGRFHVKIEAIGRHLVVPHRVGDIGAELVPQYGMKHIAGARPILLVTVPGDVGAMAPGIAGVGRFPASARLTNGAWDIQPLAP